MKNIHFYQNSWNWFCCQVCHGGSLAVYLLWPTFDPLFVGTDGTHFLRSLDGGPPPALFSPKNGPLRGGPWTLLKYVSLPTAEKWQAGIVQSIVRLVKQLLTLSPVMFIFQAKVSTLESRCFVLVVRFTLWGRSWRTVGFWALGEDLSTNSLVPSSFWMWYNMGNWIWINEWRGWREHCNDFLQHLSIHCDGLQLW